MVRRRGWGRICVLPVMAALLLIFERGGVDGLAFGGVNGVRSYHGTAWRGALKNFQRKPPVVVVLQRLRGGGGKKYYRVLGLQEGCDDEEEIKRAYKRAAMKWHPDRVKEPLKKEAESKFKEIGEAYETLSDPDRKVFYDRYGDQGVDSARERGDPSQGRAAYAGRAAEDDGFDFAFNDPFEVFQNLFGGAMGGGGMGMHGMGMHGMGTSGRDMFGRTVFHTPGGVHVVMGQPSVLGIGIELLSKVAEDWMASRAQQRGQPRTVEVPVHCTLEELLEGCTKQLKGPVGCGDDEFVVEVEPGWKDGTRVSFLSEGQGGESINVVFVVKEETHPCLRREGNDLRWICACTAAEAADGLKVAVPLLGKGARRRLALKPGWIQDGKVHRIAGMGMPIRGGPERGDFLCEFTITSRTTRALNRLGATCWASLSALGRKLRETLLALLAGIGAWLQATVFEPLARTEQWAWLRDRALKVLPHLVTFVILLFVNPMYAYIQAAAMLAQLLGIFEVQQGSGGRRRRR